MSIQLEPTLTIKYRDPDLGWEGFCVLDRLVDGIAIGGVRMTPTVDEVEVRRLARGMTLKNAAIGVRAGGGKSGIRFDPTDPRKPEVLERFLAHLAPYCNTMYAFGPDLNTSLAELDAIGAKVGIDWRFGALAVGRPDREALKTRYLHALALRYGPFSMGDVRTGIGVASAAMRTAQELGLTGPLRVAIHGFGAVGAGTAWCLARAGHRVVAVSDIGGSYSTAAGLDVDALLAARGKQGYAFDPTRLPPSVVAQASEDVLYHDVDVLVLAATPDVVHADNVGRVKARLLVEGANIAVTAAAAAQLHQRGVPVVPDFIASGGATLMGYELVRGSFVHDDAANLAAQLDAKVGDVAARALRASRARGETMRRAALAELGDLGALDLTGS